MSSPWLAKRAAPIFLLSDLFLVPEVTRRGVGALLLKSVIETAHAAGAVHVELATAMTNRPAQRLYEALERQRDEFYQYGLSLNRRVRVITV